MSFDFCDAIAVKFAKIRNFTIKISTITLFRVTKLFKLLKLFLLVTFIPIFYMIGSYVDFLTNLY